MDTFAAQERGFVTAGAGETSAVEVDGLARDYAGLLFRVAYSVVHCRAEAEDVVQDVFVRVLKRRDRLEEVRDMRVWLVRIAWNLALDRRRRVRPEQMEEAFAAGLAATSAGPEQALAEATRMAAVLSEIGRLPKGERHALLLATVEGLETREMAEVLGKSESSVRALVFRARTRLRERMGQGGGR